MSLKLPDKNTRFTMMIFLLMIIAAYIFHYSSQAKLQISGKPCQYINEESSNAKRQPWCSSQLIEGRVGSRNIQKKIRYL